MDWWEAIVLGLVQGLTEFLPVSSSGHLVIGRYVLGLGADDVVFEVFVHFGTVLSIIAVYRKDLLDLLRVGIEVLLAPRTLRARYADSEELRMLVFVTLTLIPTGLAYVLFGDRIEAAFDEPRLASAMLLVTGVLLLLTALRRNPTGPLSPLKSLLIGAAQALAMIPGISRSGATICTALYLDVEPQKAANFSFIMLLPVVIGGTLLKTAEVLSTGSVAWGVIAIGTLVAFLSGVVAIRLVLDFVRKGRLTWFAWYCFAVGALGLVLIS